MPKATVDLTGNWEFKEFPVSARTIQDLNSTAWHQCSVPSSVFNCLITSDKIKRADIEASPENFAWVSEKPWIFRKTFDVSQQLFDCDRLELVFDGLDTIATIWLNGKLLAKTDNMFIPHRFDVTKQIMPTNNILMVKFDSAIEHAKKLMNRYTVFKESDFPNPYRAYIRKAQYQFGWDFCPSLPGCGIWKPVRIEAAEKAVIRDLHISTIESNHKYADIKVTVTLDTISEHPFTCKLTLSDSQLSKQHNITFAAGENCHSTIIRIHEPILWFPAGYGQPHLYTMHCQLLRGKDIIDNTEKQFGIRTVNLNRSPDKYGEKFQIEVNGQPVYAKGANWMPVSLFAGSVTQDDYQKLLTAAADANINLLRVWAGGYYEDDKFYQLCDKLGIMVWQDFMFASAYYPDMPFFMDKISREAETIIKRLRSHPCIVLWCGNSQIDWLHGCGKLGGKRKFYGKQIYHSLLPQLCEELTTGSAFIPTTPTGKSKQQNNTNSGTFHQQDVWTNHQPVSQYLCRDADIPRFVAEFGLQSMPDMQTTAAFCPQHQLYLAGEKIEKHNYQPDGNSRLYRYTCDLFGPPANLEQFIYLSQLTQARAVKKYVEFLSAKKNINAAVLLQQFNDCFAAISSSAIDYTKTPKALYYYARRFFSGTLITIMPEIKASQNPSLSTPVPANVVAINNTQHSLAVTMTCRLMDLSANILDQVSMPVVIAPYNISPPLKLPYALTHPENPHNSCLHMLMEKNGQTLAENLFFYLPDKYIDWPEVKITRELSQISEKKWLIKLSSDAVARDVAIYTSNKSQLSDNFLTLIPGNDIEITAELTEDGFLSNTDVTENTVNNILNTRRNKQALISSQKGRRRKLQVDPL